MSRFEPKKTLGGTLMALSAREGAGKGQGARTGLTLLQCILMLSA